MLRINIEEDCPTNDFSLGKPNGKCWGDNHYECKNCSHFRADFNENETKRETFLDLQKYLQIKIFSL